MPAIPAWSKLTFRGGVLATLVPLNLCSWASCHGACRFITPPDMKHKTPDQGAETSVYLASAPELEGVTGRYFQDCVESQSSKLSHDRELAIKMWEESARLVGLDANSLLQSEDVVHVSASKGGSV